ncbi:hypothetical protein M378DRAFT_182407 [Amanita muscaria Koide BX008]|uniref:Uncharacterized protein n=1 Tax=Amanita muscaria (strain Koide BX008) TaxID=946122 RepID=A0A0C2W120_AMAMK|nr:hypothetical protein M378DRAFT_182407 [Amanita muscaria Koide BX008]
MARPSQCNWIEQVSSYLHPQRTRLTLPQGSRINAVRKWVHSMIGYHLDIQGSLCEFNIGLAIKQIVVEPRGIIVAAYVESEAHKLTPLEKESILNKTDEITLRRLATVLALKQAYIKAIDWFRLEFNWTKRRRRGTETCSSAGNSGFSKPIWASYVVTGSMKNSTSVCAPSTEGIDMSDISGTKLSRSSQNGFSH